MKTFLSLFPSFYLVDNVPYWVVLSLFIRWYDGYSSEASLRTYLIELGCALLLATLARFVQNRKVFFFGKWLTKPLEEVETVNMILITLSLYFLGLWGYEDVIELSGSPQPEERFPVGKIRSLLVMNMILVFVYAFHEKWRSVLAITADFYRMYLGTKKTSASAPSSTVLFGASSQWLPALAVMLSIAIVLVDLMILTLPLALTYPLFGLGGGVFVFFMIFNACWEREVNPTANLKASYLQVSSDSNENDDKRS